MQGKFSTTIVTSVASLGLGLAGAVSSDVLTQTVQEDLIEVGYDRGIDDGEPSEATAIAIAKFEADRDMTGTGEVTQQLSDASAADLASAAKDPGITEDEVAACQNPMWRVVPG